MRTLKHWGTSFLLLYILLVWPPDDGDRVMPVSKATDHKSSFTCCSELFISVPVQQRKRRLKTAVKDNYILLERKHTYEDVPASIHDMYSNLIADFSRFFIRGSAQGEGLGGGHAPTPPPPYFLEKIVIKITFPNKRNLWWNKNIRLANLAEASKFMISPCRSYIIR